ncbi:hypothetical protein R80B4_02675 [Fibrobacteres bacterium R8-0-B4]
MRGNPLIRLIQALFGAVVLIRNNVKSLSAIRRKSRKPVPADPHPLVGNEVK